METKVKYYGMFDMTKKQYVSAQLAAFVALILLWIWAIFGNFNELLFGIGIPLLAITTVAEAIETFVMLKKFNTKTVLQKK